MEKSITKDVYINIWAFLGIVLITLSLPSCKEKSYSNIDPFDSSKLAGSCINKNESTILLPTKGCVNNFYSIVDGSTLLIAKFPEAEDYIGCEEVKINAPGCCQMSLFEFEKGKAHFTNFCTCLVDFNKPRPIDTFEIYSANLIIEGVKTPDSFWTATPLKSIVFKNATFHSKSGKKRHLKNKAFINIVDVGPAG